MATMMEKISEGMKSAMKNKEQFRLEVLRMMKSQLMQVNSQGKIEDKDAVKILAKYAKSLKETLAIAEQHNKREVVDNSRKELAVVQEFLPAELTEEQIKAKVQEVLAGLGTVTVKDMGRVMKECMTKIQGADGSIIKKFVGEFLK
jgi:uncharacterized protein